MSQKSISVLVLVFFFSGFNLARAEVVINEVAWGGTKASSSDEWIELYNNGLNTQDLTGWALYEGGGVTKIINLSGSIASKSYFLIERTNDSVTDISADVSGSFSGSGLSNGGEFLVLKNDIMASVDSLDFASGWPAGSASPNYFSMERIDSSVSGSLATNWASNNGTEINGKDSLGNSLNGTPKAKNSTPSSPADDSSSSGSGSSSSSGSSTSATITTPEPKIKVIENPTMKVKILANALTFAGEPLEIKTSVSGFSNENVILGRAYWNFGDGGSLEQINNFEKFYHTYYYPGEYVLFLEYYQNSFSKTPEATSKMTIKVLATTITISKVGDAKDFFIELSNNASSDIDISNWFIMANGKTFILPKNSVIMSKKQMTISGKITGFSYGDQSNLKLYSGTGELVFDYSSPLEPIKILAKNYVPIKISTTLQPPEVAISVPAKQIIAEDLLATPAGAQGSVLPPLIIPLASLVFIGTSAGAVYFIRRKKIIPQTGNDFEILDE